MNHSRPELLLVQDGRDMYSVVHAHPIGSGELQVHIADFLMAKRRKWRPKTYTNYHSILNLYAAHVGSHHWPPTRRGVLSWLDALYDSEVSQTTINTYWIHLRTFLNFLEKSGEISADDNPVHQIVALELDPEPEDLPPAAFPDEDLDRLFDYYGNSGRYRRPVRYS